MGAFVIFLLVCGVLSQGDIYASAQTDPYPTTGPQTGRKWIPPASYLIPKLLKRATGTCSSPDVLDAGGRYGWKKVFGTVPASYENNEICYWKIQSTGDKRVMLHFNRMDMSLSCVTGSDHVEIYDGSDASAPLSWTVCGNTPPADITSSGNDLYVKFITNANGVGSGVRIRYSIVSCKALEVLTASSGEFGTTPSYGNYEACSWKIQVTSGKLVKMNFERFDLEYGNSSCPYDKVKLYDGNDDSAPLIGTYCGTTTALSNVVSSGNTMFVTFTSDLSIIKPGFWANFAEVSLPTSTKTIPPEAYDDQVLSSTSGTCSSPSTISADVQDGWSNEFGNAGSQHGMNEDCRWTVQAPAGKRVKLRFTRFDVSCDGKGGYIYAYDGPSTSSSGLLGNDCGNKSPFDVKTTGNVAYVRFYTYDAPVQAGIRCRPSVVSCDQMKVLTASSGDFGTTPSTYGNYEDCSWKIQVTSGKTVKLDFRRFELEYGNSGCPYDHVKVYDGSDDSASLLGTYCGTDLPSSVVSSGNTMFVSFSTDLSITRDGFWADYVEV